MASPVTRTKPMSGITFVVRLACFTGLHWMSVRDTVPLACIQQPRYIENMPHDTHVDTESPMAHS